MEKYYGILTRTDWNTNKWEDKPTEEDLKTAEFNKDNAAIFSSLNYGHEHFSEPDQSDMYQGYLPQLSGTVPKPDDIKNIHIVFIQSKSPETQKEYITGLYAFPVLSRGRRASPFPEFSYLNTNIKALPKNIHKLENYLDVDTINDKIISANKKLRAKRTYNYLTKTDVEKILDAMTKSNAEDKKLHAIKFRILKNTI